jgi:hypothetical protein
MALSLEFVERAKYMRLLSARTIRQSIFEFFLIFAGVLVALGVDQWRSDRDEFTRLEVSIEALRAEIERNIGTIEVIQKRVLPLKIQRIQRLIDFLESGDLAVVDEINFLGEVLRSTTDADIWFSRNQYDALLSEGGLKLLSNRDLEFDLSGIFQANTVLMRQTLSLRSDYPTIISGIIPIQYNSSDSPVLGYALGAPVAPVSGKKPAPKATIQLMYQNSETLLPAARSEVAYAVAKWYALERMAFDFREMQVKLEAL